VCWRTRVVWCVWCVMEMQLGTRNARCTPQMYIGVRFQKSGQIFEIWPDFRNLTRGVYLWPPQMSNIPPS
jgi:hypothetical protein